MDFQPNDQVIVRKRVRSGNLIRMGSIIKVDGDKARVHFPIDHSQAVIPIEQLEKTSERFGGFTRVQASAIQRSMMNRKGLA